MTVQRGGQVNWFQKWGKRVLFGVGLAALFVWATVATLGSNQAGGAFANQVKPADVVASPTPTNTLRPLPTAMPTSTPTVTPVRDEYTTVVAKMAATLVVEIISGERTATAAAKQSVPAATVTPTTPIATPQPTPTYSRMEVMLATLVARGEVAPPVVTATVSVSSSVTVAKGGTGFPKALYISPVSTTKVINEETKWLFAEPGVILDNTTAWTIASTKQVYYSNVPEGAFAFYSCGSCTVSVNGDKLVQEPVTGTNYLVVIRGRIDDGLVDTDRNTTVTVTNFVPGHMIYSHTPVGAYVSANWFMEQLQASSQVTDPKKSFTDCGALGCSTTIVKAYDIDSRLSQVFEVKAKDLLAWKLVETNMRP